MKQTDIKKEIEALKLNTAIITEPQTKAMFNGLLNLVEKLYAENEQLKEKNQKLKDEINHLKGEQGKPDIKKRNCNNSDHSSEKERKENSKGEEKKGRNREAKLPKVKIDREVMCPVDK